jgi:hypothetical protein
MSIDATNWAWSQRDVTPSEKLILLSYADRAGETHEAWPSWSRLIIDTGLDRKTIYYGLTSLQKKGKMIKTGEKKRQVYVYKLVGVEGREHKNPALTSSKNGTSAKSPTSSKNGTGTSSKNGTSGSSKNGTKKHQLNHPRNPKTETPSFSSFSDFKTLVTALVTATGKKPIDVLVDEVIFYADKFQEKRDPMESVNMAIPLIKSGLWKTPHGFKGITSQAIRKQDEEYEQQKQAQIQQDAKIGRAINQAVKTGDRKSLADMLKEFKHDNATTMPETDIQCCN